MSWSPFGIVDHDPEHMTNSALEDAFLYKSIYIDRGYTDMVRNVGLHKLDCWTLMVEGDVADVKGGKEQTL